MARIGAFCFPETGHLTPTLAVLTALAARGHDLVVFTVPDMEGTVRRAGLRSHAVGLDCYAAGTHARRRAHMGRLSGVAAAAVSGHYSGLYTEGVLADGTAALAAEPVDLLVIDQIDVGAHAVADRAGIPFVTIALCLIMNADEWHPVWAPEPAPDRRLTAVNRKWRAVFDHLYAPQRARINRFRAAGGLPPFSDLADLWSPIAQVSQQPEGFEFTRPLPSTLHFAGPFTNPALRQPVDFPWERLTGQPIIYAAFGSLVNGDVARIETIVQACRQFDAQLVLQLDGGHDALVPFGSDAVVVPFAPQVELLKRACLMITHAGLNSTLECLSAGVPMVAMPITNDELAIAARIAWTTTGVVVPDRTPDRLQAAVAHVLSDDRYQQAAGRFRDAIARRDGATHAADIIETAAGINGLKTSRAGTPTRTVAFPTAG